MSIKQTHISKKKQKKLLDTPLSKSFAYVIPGALLAFASLLHVVYQQRKASENVGTCTPSFFQLDGSPDSNFRLLITGASAGAVLSQINRIIVKWSQGAPLSTFAAYGTAMTIMIISFFSELVTLQGCLGFTTDAFGVKAPAVQWAEWQITVPLMLFMTLSLDGEKVYLSSGDFLLILNSWLPVFCGWTLTWTSDTSIGRIIFTVAVTAFTYQLWCTYKGSIENYTRLQKILTTSSVFPENYALAAVATRKLNCTMVITLLFPMFPTVYLLTAFNVIDGDTGYFATTLLNYGSKVLFVFFVMDGHLEVLDPVTFQLLAEKKANEARRAFLRYVFHEVRSPLNSMTMGLQVLHSSDISEDDKESVSMMREAVTYMSDTLRDVLNIQKVEEGVLELEYEQFVVDDMLQSVFSTYKELISDKNIKIGLEVQHDVPWLVWGDALRIAHVFGNLMSNAIKFSPSEGNVNIFVSFEDGCITVRIRDYGPGIAEADQKTLFVPFATLRPGECKPGRGAGVGLAICKEIINLHDGEVGCKSFLGDDKELKGSEFYFTVPFEIVENACPTGVNDRAVKIADFLKKSGFESSIFVKISSNVSKSPSLKEIVSAAENEEPSKAFLSLSDEPEVPGLPERTLIVDDVLSNRKMLGMILTKKGLVCDMVIDGLEAVKTIQENPKKYQLVFMDNMMPNMNGVQATRSIRSLGFSHVICGLTGNTMEDEIIEFEEAGADCVFSKPLKMDKLEELLQYFLQRGTKTTIGKRLSDSDTSLRRVLKL